MDLPNVIYNDGIKRRKEIKNDFVYVTQLTKSHKSHQKSLYITGFYYCAVMFGCALYLIQFTL